LATRTPGPLDFVPIRPRAKRIHLGSRLALAGLLAALAIVFALAG
jgi:hypothetical protein